MEDSLREFLLKFKDSVVCLCKESVFGVVVLYFR